MNKLSRVDNISDKDKLWELHLHTLAGFHGNTGANDKSPSSIAKASLVAAKEALDVWKNDQR